MIFLQKSWQVLRWWSLNEFYPSGHDVNTCSAKTWVLSQNRHPKSSQGPQESRYCWYPRQVSSGAPEIRNYCMVAMRQWAEHGWLVCLHHVTQTTPPVIDGAKIQTDTFSIIHLKGGSILSALSFSFAQAHSLCKNGKALRKRFHNNNNSSHSSVLHVFATFWLCFDVKSNSSKEEIMG